MCSSPSQPLLFRMTSHAVWSTTFICSSFIRPPCTLKWAEQSLDPAWCELIRKAWTERMGVRFGGKVRQPAQTRLLHETAKFIAYAQSLAETSLSFREAGLKAG